jgi:hypothetical protein
LQIAEDAIIKLSTYSVVFVVVAGGPSERLEHTKHGKNCRLSEQQISSTTVVETTCLHLLDGKCDYAAASIPYEVILIRETKSQTLQ